MTDPILEILMGSKEAADAWEAWLTRKAWLTDEICSGYCPPFIDPDESEPVEYHWDSPAYWLDS
jgi:hypothetical protein